MSSTSRSKPPRRRGAFAEVSPLEAHLGYWLRFVSNHVSDAFRAKVEHQGVTVAEWVVLRALFDEDGVKPSELSEAIGMTRGTISKLVERLAAKDLVIVRGDAVDRRAQRVLLSDSGRRIVPTLAALADENDAEVFGHLTDEQRATLLALLQSIVDRLGLTSPPVD